MVNPENYRAYGVLLRAGQVMISAEYVGSVFAWKYPGGGVWPNENAEQAVIREFREEASLIIDVVGELYEPGTLISPWINVPYSPIYYAVKSDGDPIVPDHENVELSFMDPAAVFDSELVASPEKVALKRALEMAG